MWVAIICTVVIIFIFKLFFTEDDEFLDLRSSNSTALFTVARRLEKLYSGSKVYVGLRIPDPDSASPRNIDLVLVTKQEVVVIAVNNLSAFVSIDKNGNWMCTGGSKHKTESIPDPVAETSQLVPVLEAYLEQRGVALPEGSLSCKVICPNPKFQTIDSDSFPPEVITHDRWTQLKPEKSSVLSGWMKGAFHGGTKKMQDSIYEKLTSVLSTSPMWDRLELKGNKYILGEFLEFKGKEDDLQALRYVKRSKVGQLIVQKMSMFGFAPRTLQVMYTSRDYRVEGSSSSQQGKEVTVRSSTEVVFQPQNSSKVRKYKLSSVISLTLSA